MAGGLLLLPQPDGAILAVYALTLFGVAANTPVDSSRPGGRQQVAVARVIGESTMVVWWCCCGRGAGDLAKVPLASSAAICWR
jgi:hypothetical protein